MLLMTEIIVRDWAAHFGIDPEGVEDISRWLSASDTTGNDGLFAPRATPEGPQNRSAVVGLCDPFGDEIKSATRRPVVSHARRPANIRDPAGVESGARSDTFATCCEIAPRHP